jgi:hypothetical protein
VEGGAGVVSTKPALRFPSSSVLLVLAAEALTLVAALLGGRVFEHGYPAWPILFAVVACTVVALASFALSVAAVASVAAHVFVVAVTGVLAAGAVGGGAGDAARAPFDGVRIVLQARWPVPLAPAGVAFVAMACALAFAVTAEIVRRRRFQVATLAPAVVLLAVLALLGAPAGTPTAIVLASFVVLGVIVLWLARRQASPTAAPVARATAFGVAGAVLASALVPFVVGSGAAASRFDPRTNDAIDQVEQELSPLARLDELRTRQPATTLFTASGASFERWTLVSLPRYDGQSWMPAADFRPTGRQLVAGRASAGAQQVSLEMGDLVGHWLPTPGEVVHTSLAVSVDSARSGLLVPAGLAQGQTITLDVVSHAPDQALLATASAGRRSSIIVGPTALPSSIAELASTAVQGATSDFERAQRIEQFLKKNYALDSTALPGHTLGLLQLFLEQTRRGRDEQFVAAYGILASAVGLPVRIAVGFVPKPPVGDVTTVTSADVRAWPEVFFGSFGWVRFDPVPSVDTPATGQPAADPSAQTRPAPAQAPPVPRTIPPTNSVPPDVAGPAASVSSPLPVAVKVGLGAFGLALAVAAYVFGVLTLKERRRRRLHELARADRRVTGAFLASVDVLVDLGLDAPRSATDAELVGAGRSLLSSTGGRRAVGLVERAEAAGPADTDEAQENADVADLTDADLAATDEIGALGDLADRSTAAVYDLTPVSDESADVAWQQMLELERHLARSVGPVRWLRARLSLRSLRRGLTADPPSTSP